MEQRNKETNEQQLSFEQYRLMLDNFPGNVVLTDGNGIIIYVNQRCIELWKDESTSLVGQHTSIFRTSGFALETGNEYVLKHKKRFIKYLKTQKHAAESYQLRYRY